MNLQSAVLPFSGFFFFFIFFFLAVQADLNSDKEALLSFAASFPLAYRLNWRRNTTVCSSWIGVTCDPNKSRVIALRLPGTGLSGFIPANTIGKLDALRVLSLRSNYLDGDLPSDVASLPSLQFLYLQQNNFSGNIPKSLSSRLIVLDLSYNSFGGRIPSQVQNLSQLVVLHLQNNSLTGSIPVLDIPSLKVLNLSYNGLNGSIPFELRKFSRSSFKGNFGLCGSPLEPCPGTASSPSPSYLPTSTPISGKLHSHGEKLGTAAIIAIAVGGSVVLLVLLASALVVYCVKKKNKDNGHIGVKKTKDFGNEANPNDFGSGVQEPEKNKLFFFEGCTYSFDLEDLLRASAEVLGKGSFGTAYKAVIDDGTAVVVKRLREVAVSKREFEQQMEALGRIGHRDPNVAPLVAYYYSKDEKLLVYEYMPAGSLFSLLHGSQASGRAPPDWDTRMKIALGTAKGISYIHSETAGPGAKCVHGDIKSSNVLLTQDREARVSDFGLAPLMNFPSSASRAIGYQAPEVFEMRKMTEKSDVYSFGVLILEMLTGKAPVPQSGHDDVVLDLPRWVRSVVREEWTAEVFDVELLKYQNIEEQMVQMLQIGLACVAKAPDTRPKMADVVRMIEDVFPSESQNRTSSEAESNNVQTP